MKKATIKICGKKVDMLYCAAAETGYEKLSGKSSEVFIPKRAMSGDQPVNDSDGNPIYNAPEAMLDDYIKLAVSAIIAAYAREGKDAPITTKDILYDAPPNDVTTIVATVTRLRNEWYTMPAALQNDEISEDVASKNA